MVRVLLISVVFVVVFDHQDSLWMAVRESIPGGNAVRAIGRVVLILLVPLGLGLAALVQYLMRNGHALLGWTVAVLCIAEQGVTTDSYDVATNTQRITTLAQKINLDQEVFFYHPDQKQSFFHYQLDAMWASLLSGVPTINGYSGYYPRGWEGFFLVDTHPEIELPDVLLAWERRHGLTHSRVQWIGVAR
jgi:hypothetical protein